jgi:hypothetical protein
MTDPCSRTEIDCDAITQLYKGDNRQLVPSLLDVVWDLEPYWALSLRQIYYQAVAALLVRNDQSQYRRIMSIMKTAREHDLLPWRAMEDRARRTTEKQGLSGLEEFLEENLGSALNWRYYHRCHLQGQPIYAEVTVEKDALAPLVEEVCWPLCTRMSVTKGQPSVTLMEQIARRMEAALQRGQEAVLLHFGDLDPTGVQIPLSMRDTLWEVHGLDVRVVMGGLTPQQCATHRLPQSLDAAKADDPNYDRWVSRFPGQAPTELDALHPKLLQQLVETKLLELYDDALMAEQRAQEKDDEDVLKAMRRSMLHHLETEFPEVMAEIEID